jgi:hypothetical protein
MIRGFLGLPSAVLSTCYHLGLFIFHHIIYMKLGRITMIAGVFHFLVSVGLSRYIYGDGFVSYDVEYCARYFAPQWVTVRKARNCVHTSLDKCPKPFNRELSGCHTVASGRGCSLKNRPTSSSQITWDGEGLRSNLLTSTPPSAGVGTSAPDTSVSSACALRKAPAIEE